MDGVKYAGTDVCNETISIAVKNSAPKYATESIIGTKWVTTLEFIQ